MATTDLEQGEQALAARQYGDAQVCFRRAAQAEPDNLRAWRGLAEAETQLQRYEAACVACEKIIAHAPDDAPAHAALGRLHERLGQYGLAVAELTLAAQLDPHDAQSAMALGRLVALGYVAPATVVPKGAESESESSTDDPAQDERESREERARQAELAAAMILPPTRAARGRSHALNFIIGMAGALALVALFGSCAMRSQTTFDRAPEADSATYGADEPVVVTDAQLYSVAGGSAAPASDRQVIAVGARDALKNALPPGAKFTQATRVGERLIVYFTLHDSVPFVTAGKLAKQSAECLHRATNRICEVRLVDNGGQVIADRLGGARD